MIADRDGRAIVRAIFACVLLLLLAGISSGLLAGDAPHVAAAPTGASPTPSDCCVFTGNIGATCAYNSGSGLRDVGYSADVVNSCGAPVSTSYNIYLEVSEDDTNFTFITRTSIENYTFQPGHNIISGSFTAQSVAPEYRYYRVRMQIYNCGIYSIYSPSVPLCGLPTQTPVTASATFTRTATASATRTATATPIPTCGLAWRQVAAPNFHSNSNSLNGVKAIASNDAWAVGDYNNPGTGYQDALTAHWDGSQWLVVPNPSYTQTFNTLLGVAAVSAREVWAVGYYQPQGGIPRTLIMHWNGSQWSLSNSPNVGNGANYLRAVSASPSGDVWAVGHYVTASNTVEMLAVRNVNGSWVVVPGSGPGTSVNRLYSVAAMTSSDVWAVGLYNEGNNTRTLTMHWDGTQWSTVPSPNPNPNQQSVLNGVSGTGGSDVWAVGSYFNSSAVEQTLVLHWNGQNWSIVPSPNHGTSDNSLYGVRAISADDAWAVGNWSYQVKVSRAPRTLALHWNGTQWSEAALPALEGSTNLLKSVDAASADDVWAVGYDLPPGQSFTSLVERYSDPCVGGTPSPGPIGVTATPTACTNNIQLFYERFESGTLGQFTSTVIISSTTTPSPTPGWTAAFSNPHTGRYEAFAPDPDRITDQRLTSSDAIVIPTSVSSATLTFWHNFGLENAFDGGVLEVSTDGGVTWADADQNIIVGRYNSSFISFECDPLPPFRAGKRFWSGNSNGYQQVVVNLLPYAGNSFKFRFRLGTDCAVRGNGWHVDDIAVNIIQACPTSTATTTPTPTVAATHTPTACPTSPSTQLFFEGFESGTLSQFTSTAIISSTTTPVPTPGWTATITNPHTGGYAAFAPDPDKITDSRLTLINSIHIPTGVSSATLTFWHNFDMENMFDGGVLEVSTNGGATWADADNGIIVGGYNSSKSVIESCAPGPPVFPNGKRFWSNVSNGYRQVVVNLLPYAGTDFKFRFRLGTDCSMGDVGWFIDDIEVNIGGVCLTPTVTATQPTSTPTPTRTVTTTPTPCPFTQVFFEGFERGVLATFTSTVFMTLPTTATPNPTPGWAAVTASPYTGNYSAFGPDPDRVTDQRLTLVNPIAIPAEVSTATLTFRHRFGFENTFDGAVLEVSTDGGATWHDADQNILVGRYNGTITVFPVWPPPPFPAGKRVWTGSQPNYGPVVVNLLPYAGREMKFRFRIGTDMSVGGAGWYVDDIEVNIGEGCITPTATRPTSTPTTTRTATRTRTVTPISTSTPEFTPSNTPPTLVPTGTASTIPPPATRTETAGVPTVTVTSIPPTSTACTIQFADVQPPNTFYPYVRCLACRGIIGGYPDG
ncbi:MAG: immune inhibitor A, partial [Chloroflexota bacterium]|nr:immune inhibitor A [Chloroflexota bacterium]